LREIELKVQREINEKRQELLAKEESLRYVAEWAVRWIGMWMLMGLIGTWRAAWLHRARRTSSTRWICLGVEAEKMLREGLGESARALGRIYPHALRGFARAEVFSVSSVYNFMIGCFERELLLL
jgi:hypothetical protein